MQTPENEPLQALTLRLPESEYRLLRALAFARETSINGVVVMAVRRLLEDPEDRPVLKALLEQAQALRPGRRLPRNPHGKGRRKPSS